MKYLFPKFKDLDCIIYNHANISHNSDLAESGGYHGVLFMLKSLDLDFRCENEPFTIFGYDYNCTFAELNLIEIFINTSPYFKTYFLYPVLFTFWYDKIYPVVILFDMPVLIRCSIHKNRSEEHTSELQSQR